MGRGLARHFELLMALYHALGSSNAKSAVRGAHVRENRAEGREGPRAAVRREGRSAMAGDPDLYVSNVDHLASWTTYGWSSRRIGNDYLRIVRTCESPAASYFIYTFDIPDVCTTFRLNVTAADETGGIIPSNYAGVATFDDSVAGGVKMVPR